MRDAVFFYTSGRSGNYLDELLSFHRTHGPEGFLVEAEGRPTLLERVFASTRPELAALKTEMVSSWKKGTRIRGKTLFEVLLNNQGASDATSLRDYLFRLELIFSTSSQGSVDFPWGKKDLFSREVEEMNRILEEIKDKEEFSQEASRLRKLLGTVAPLADLAKNLCSLKSLEELERAKSLMPGAFESAEHDVLGCLIKNGQCDLAENVIQSGLFPQPQIKNYFHQLFLLPDSLSCSRALKAAYASMLSQGLRPERSYLQRERHLLYELPLHLSRYPQELNAFCHAEVRGSRYSIDALENAMVEVMQFQAFAALSNIHAEEEPVRQQDLIAQLKEQLKLLQYHPLKEPRSGKTMLMLLAEKGDVETLELLAAKGIFPSDLGLLDERDGDEKVITSGILSGDIKKLAFSRRVVDLTPMHEGVLYEAQFALRKLRSKDPEIKKVRQKFQSDIRDKISNIY
jgi:hypothetical protein